MELLRSAPSPDTAAPAAADRSYYNIAQAAALLGVSRVTIWRWIREGRLPAAQLGHRTTRIGRADLECLLIAHGPPASRPGAGHDPGGAPRADWWAVGPCEHLVQFYDTDAFLLDAVGDFIGAALRAGDAGIVVATPAHREGLEGRLRAHGLDVDGAHADGRYAALDAAETLARLMVDGTPDPARFAAIIGARIAAAAAGGRRVRAFGEMVALLAAEGDHAAAVRLEALWGELQATHPFALFCAYPLARLDGAAQAAFVGQVCAAHSRVVPAESYTALDDPDDRLRAIAVLQQKAHALEVEVAQRRRAETELRDCFEQATVGLHWVGADGTILWANQAELDLLGYRAEEYIGRHIATFHADQEVIGDILERLARKEILREHEARLRCKDGSIKHVLMSSNVLWDGDTFVHTRCFTVDITARTLAERRLAVQFAVTRILSEAETLDQAAAPILRSVCESLGWEAGALWSVDRQAGAVRCDAFWHTESIDLAGFKTTSCGYRFPPGVGLPGRVWASGQPVWLPDVLADDNFPTAPAAASAGLRGAFAFPVRAGGAVLGALEFFSREIRRPDAELLALLAGVGSQIGQFIERRQAEEERGRLLAAERQARAEAEVAVRWLQAVQAISDAALTHLSTTDLLRELLARLVEVLDVDNAAILIPTEGGQELLLHLARGPEEQIAGQVRVPIGQGIAGTIAATRQPLIVADLRTAEVANPFLKQTIRSLMGIPLVVEGRLVGVLHAGTATPRQFTEDDLLLLRLVGDRIAPALEHARLYEEEQRLRAEAQDHAAELAAIFEAITDAVLVFGPAGEVRRWNSAARDLLGMDALPAVYAQPLRAWGQGAEVWDTRGRPLPPAQWPLFRVLRGEVLTGESAADHVAYRRDGVAREFSVSGAPIRDAQGATTGAVCVLRDVTERRRLEARVLAERNRLQQVLDALPEGVVIADAQPPAVVAMNRAAGEFLGLDLVGRPVPIPPPGADGAGAARRLDGTPYPLEELPLERALLRGEVVRGDQFRIRNAQSGREVAILANSAPLRDPQGAVDGAVEVFQDISALKELERQREQFLATVSHDLKNPLTSILGLSELLQRRTRRLATPDQARLDEGLGAIMETARGMARQIDELLDVTRAQMGRPLALELAPTDLAALVAGVVDEYQRTTERHTLRLQSAPGPLVGLVDAARLRRALANLLANAIKYSPQGGEIRIILACATDQGGTWLTIGVADRGVGIPPAEADRVFEGFYRASNVTGPFTGTGLGLAGVRQVVEQHGGTVVLESAEGAGTRVTVRLPLRLPPLEAAR